MKRAEQLRADFVANASHELRTPLAALSGFIDTLKGHARDDMAAREQFLGIMTVEAERMRRLIDDLLSLTRIEQNEHVPPSGEASLETRPARSRHDADAARQGRQHHAGDFGGREPSARHRSTRRADPDLPDLIHNAINTAARGAMSG